MLNNFLFLIPINLHEKGLLIVWYNHFLDSRAEIQQIFALVFWKVEDTKKSFCD